MPDPVMLQPGTYIVPTPPPVPPPVAVNRTILPALQTAPFRLLWGVGRSHPVENPAIHGTATFTPGEPAILDYHPVNLPDDRDNLYCLRELGKYLPDFSSATKFTETEIYTISNVTAPEALETDWHLQPVGTKVFNPGLQLLHGNPWSLRLWDHKAKDWNPNTGVTFDGARLLAGLAIGAEYIISATSLTYTAVIVDGVRFPQNFSVPAVTASMVTSQVFNKAIQVDANGVATPYTLRIGSLTVTFA